MSPDFLYGLLAGIGLVLILIAIYHEAMLYRRRRQERRRPGFVSHAGKTRVGR